LDESEPATTAMVPASFHAVSRGVNDEGRRMLFSGCMKAACALSLANIPKLTLTSASTIKLTDNFLIIKLNPPDIAL
jgi:hypothetical protein